MRRGIGLIVACAWLVIAAGASGLQPAVAGGVSPATGPIIDLDFGHISGSTCPSTTPIWAIATYDGAHLRTNVARGDGTHLALDRSVAQTRTLNTGATITGVDENLVVGAKHRKGHAPGGSGTNEDAEASSTARCRGSWSTAAR